MIGALWKQTQLRAAGFPPLFLDNKFATDKMSTPTTATRARVERYSTPNQAGDFLDRQLSTALTCLDENDARH